MVEVVVVVELLFAKVLVILVMVGSVGILEILLQYFVHVFCAQMATIRPPEICRGS